MGWKKSFKRASSAVSKAVNSASDAVTTAANSASDAVTTATSRAYSAAEDTPAAAKGEHYLYYKSKDPGSFNPLKWNGNDWSAYAKGALGIEGLKKDYNAIRDPSRANLLSAAKGHAIGLGGPGLMAIDAAASSSQEQARGQEDARSAELAAINAEQDLLKRKSLYDSFLARRKAFKIGAAQLGAFGGGSTSKGSILGSGGADLSSILGG